MANNKWETDYRRVPVSQGLAQTPMSQRLAFGAGENSESMPGVQLEPSQRGLEMEQRQRGLGSEGRQRHSRTRFRLPFRLSNGKRTRSIQRPGRGVKGEGRKGGGSGRVWAARWRRRFAQLRPGRGSMRVRKRSMADRVEKQTVGRAAAAALGPTTTQKESSASGARRQPAEGRWTGREKAAADASS